MELEEVTAGHAAVLAGLDPLLPVPGRLSPGGSGTLITARVGESAAYGLAQFSTVASDAEAALWGPLRSHRLTAYAAGPDRRAAFAALLDEWEPLLRERASPGDADCGASVTLPSRDLDTALPLVHRGFAPLTMIAVRRRPSVPAVGGGGDGVVRVATVDDLDTLVELAVELQYADAAFGMVTVRPTAAGVLRPGIEAQLARAPGLTWVGLDGDGRVVGFAQVQPPPENGWLGPAVSGRLPAYVGYLFVRPDRRGAGLGAALVDTAHRAIDADPTADTTLLHHALPSPYSTPFWARHGYRPLWTAYQRRPTVL